MPKLQSYLQLTKCPHCQIDNPSLIQKTNFWTADSNDSRKRIWGFYVCARCGGVITAYSNGLNNEVMEMFPMKLEVSEAIPDLARDFLNQAINSLHAPSGAIMLAASSIDAMLKDKGYKTGKLYSRIKKANDDNLITDGMKMWADQVRLEANIQRHADDEYVMPTQDEANRVIDFTLALGEFIFVLPSKVEKGIKESEPTKAN